MNRIAGWNSTVVDFSSSSGLRGSPFCRCTVFQVSANPWPAGRTTTPMSRGVRLKLTLTRVSPPGQGHEVTYKFFAPDGSEFLSSYMSGSQASATQNFETPVTGAYTLYLDPSWGYATTLTASIAPY